MGGKEDSRKMKNNISRGNRSALITAVLTFPMRCCFMRTMK